MPATLSPEEIERIAQRRASAKLRWYVHLLVFVLVNLSVFAMSKYAFGDRPWHVAPLLGWGAGLVLHGIAVFVLGGDLREHMTQRERERLQRLHGAPRE
jgi:2TM domain